MTRNQQLSSNVVLSDLARGLHGATPFQIGSLCAGVRRFYRVGLDFVPLID